MVLMPMKTIADELRASSLQEARNLLSSVDEKALAENLSILAATVGKAWD